MNVNKILVQQRLLLLREYILRMSELARSDEDVFCQNTTVSAAAESYLRRALEVVFNIGRHVLAKMGYTELSMEYKSIARGLAQQGIVSEELGEKLTRMAGYRNRLVHLYHQVTVEELYHIITENLSDFRAFSDSIQKFVPQFLAKRRTPSESSSTITASRTGPGRQARPTYRLWRPCLLLRNKVSQEHDYRHNPEKQRCNGCRNSWILRHKCC